MSDCQENIKKTIEDELTGAAEKHIGEGPFIAFTVATLAKKPIGDWRLITTAAAMDARMFFGLRSLGVGQYDALLLLSMSLVWFNS